MNCIIVAIGYNRPNSLRRLLLSLENAHYHNSAVDLVVSIDYSAAQDDVVSAISDFVWHHGSYQVRCQERRLGLRTHVLSCGDLVENYDLLIMLEDDLVVSPEFFTYAINVAAFYCNHPKIAGISLYKHESHPNLGRPFVPLCNGFDVYLMKFAQSWGQCWTKDMWLSFREWYVENESRDLSEGALLPNYIAEWNRQSWLKYFMRYITEKELYFVYPYQSLSTNVSEAGEHNEAAKTDFQVPILFGKKDYRFPAFDEAVRYDVFFEREDICANLFPEFHGKKILDLYGTRTTYDGADYVISTRALPYVSIRGIKMKYRPMEVNLLFPEDGNDIHVYDISRSDKPGREETVGLIRYDVRAMPWRSLLRLGLFGLKQGIENRCRRMCQRVLRKL